MADRFLNFDENNRRDRPCIPKVQSLLARQDRVGEPRRLNWEELKKINQCDRLEAMISVQMAKLLNIEENTYLETTIEFLASYNYIKPKTLNLDLRTAQIVSFSLGGKWHKWSVAKLGKKLGIYTHEEIDSDIFSQKYEFEEYGERERGSGRE